MKRVIGILSLGLILFLGITMAQKTEIPYADRWKNVEKLAEKQLPESALKEVESIALSHTVLLPLGLYLRQAK